MRNYYNQSVHAHLTKKGAKEALVHILDEIHNKQGMIEISRIEREISTGEDLSKLADDYLEASDHRHFADIIQEMGNHDCEPPKGFAVSLVTGEGQKGFALFYWEKSKILLFGEENYAFFNLIKNNRSGLTCYFLSEYLDVNDFCKKIRKEQKNG